MQRAYRDLITLYSKNGRENETETYRIRLANGLNEAAWQLATSTNQTIRNGAKAVVLAEEAVRNTHWKNAQHLRTLAAAYAENQQFDQAAATQREALLLLTNVKLKTDYESQLALYEQKKTYREEIKPASP